MVRGVFVVVVSFLLAFSQSASAGGVDPLVGNFQGDGVSIDVRSDGLGYAGTIHRGDKSFDFTATKDGTGWVGSFKSGENSYDCSAKFQDGVLTFTTGQKSYALKGKLVAENPLDDSNPTNPLNDNKQNAIESGKENTKSSPAVPPFVQHPNGFQCIIPVGWTGKVNGAFVELFGPASEQSGQPTYYLRAASVDDPTFTQIDDPAYLRGAIASMQQNEPGLTLDGDPQLCKQDGTQLTMISFKLQVAGLNQPLPARAVLGKLGDKKVAIVFLACEEKKITSGEEYVLGAAADMVNHRDFSKPEPAKGVGDIPPNAEALHGVWKNREEVWDLRATMLTRKLNLADAISDKNVIISGGEQVFFYALDGNKLFVATKHTDAWDRNPEKCQVYTVKYSQYLLTLVRADGTQIILEKDEKAKQD